MKKILLLCVLILIVFALSACGKKAPLPSAPLQDAPEAVKEILIGHNAVSYSMKSPYGDGIRALYLGYGEDNKIIAGIAERNFKTYIESNMIITVIPENDGFIIKDALITNIDDFPGKSKELAAEAADGVKGTIIPKEEDALKITDAVTSATQYYRSVYITAGLMASKIIDEFNSQPDWPKAPLE